MRRLTTADCRFSAASAPRGRSNRPIPCRCAAVHSPAARGSEFRSGGTQLPIDDVRDSAAVRSSARRRSPMLTMASGRESVTRRVHRRGRASTTRRRWPPAAVHVRPTGQSGPNRRARLSRRMLGVRGSMPGKLHAIGSYHQQFSSGGERSRPEPLHGARERRSPPVPDGSPVRAPPFHA